MALRVHNRHIPIGSDKSRAPDTVQYAHDSHTPSIQPAEIRLDANRTKIGLAWNVRESSMNVRKQQYT